MHNPELLILDEPINGLDPVGIKEMRELFCRLVQEREITILLSSHILSEMEHTADRIGVIVDGMVVQEIDPREIKTISERHGRLFLAVTNGEKEMNKLISLN